MPAVSARFLSLAVLSAVILPNIPNTRAMIHIAHYFATSSLTPADNPNTPSRSKDQYIPKIIHQVYHNWRDPSNETIPTDWGHVRQTCTRTNPDLEYRGYGFYRDTLRTVPGTYDSYTCPVQRANTFRCFLMRHYGGVYINPNYGCARDLEPPLYYPAWVIDRGHGITGARPNHPDWVVLTESMVARGLRFVFPHATHGGSPEFGRVGWGSYHARLPAKERKADPVYRIKTGHRDEVFFMPNGRFRDNWDYSYGYIDSTKAILGCLLLFAMLTRRLSCSWQLASKQDPSTRIPEAAAGEGRSGMVRNGLTFIRSPPLALDFEKPTIYDIQSDAQ